MASHLPPHKSLFSRAPPPTPLPPPHSTPTLPRLQTAERAGDLTDTPHKVCSPGQQLGLPRPYSPNHQPRRGDPGGSRPISGLLETNRSRKLQQLNSLILLQYLRAQRCRPQPPPPGPGLSSGQESSERRGRSRGLATDPCGRRFAPFHREAGQIQSTECGRSQGPRPSRCPLLARPPRLTAPSLLPHVKWS